jgi:glycosyltransferase involved in cell wall biosynthesis
MGSSTFRSCQYGGWLESMAAENSSVPPPSRALVVLSQLYAGGGIQRFNRMLLSALHELGLRCDVLSLGDPEESYERWNAPESATIRVFNHNKIQFALGVCSAIGRGDHDLIIVGHVNFLSLVASGLIFRPSRPKRVLMVAHGIEVWSGMDNRVTKWAAAKLNHILCVSRYTRQRIRLQRPELEDDRYTIFPNALSATWLQQRAQTHFIRSSGRLPKRFILAVTRLDQGDRYKGIPTLLESLAVLRDKSLQCVIAGEGNDRAYLEGMARRCGVSDRIHFVGAVSDAELARLYSECVAFVLPSSKEGFGIVFLEAMHFGAPVIAAREKGAVDVVEHEETGLLITYGDTIGLANAICRLLDDSDLRTRLIQNGRALVSANGRFSFRAYVARLGQLLNLSYSDSGVEAESQLTYSPDDLAREARVRSS